MEFTLVFAISRSVISYKTEEKPIFSLDTISSAGKYILYDKYFSYETRDLQIEENSICQGGFFSAVTKMLSCFYHHLLAASMKP